MDNAIFGSFNNRMMDSHMVCLPKKGTGATVIYYSDRHAATIIDVSKDGKTIVIQEDKAIRTDNNGMSECQEYRYEPNPNGNVITFTFRKNLRWVKKGQGSKSGIGLMVGERDHYRDYSF